MDRRRTRGRLIAKSRRDSRGHPLCWLCNERVGSEMHELVNRGQTVGNEEARALSFMEGLTVLLCRECHEQASLPAVQMKLWRALYALYGQNRVVASLGALNAVLRTPVQVTLPED